MESLKTIATFLKNNDFFGIISHVYPDGDALGSAFGLCRVLQKMGKHAKVLLNDPLAKKFRFLSDYTENQKFEQKYIISVDLASTTLLGENLEKYARQINICIDHHLSNKNYAAVTFIDASAAANCEIMYKLFENMGVTIDDKIASCLYTGVATDTGCFKYPNTTATSHFIAAKLIESGACIEEINKNLFTLKTKEKIETEKIMYKNLEYFFQNKCAITHITLKEIEKIGITDNELDGLASIPISTCGVIIGITIKEKCPKTYKVSVRTDGIANANNFCELFKGGGHSGAGGFAITGDIIDVKNRILEAVKSKFGW